MSTTTTQTTPAQGKMVFQLKKLAQPLKLEQDTIEHKWNVFKTVMVFLGGAAVLAWLSYGSYACGKSTTTNPVVIHYTIPAPTVQSTPAPARELTPEELDRRHSEYLRNQNR